VPPLASHLTEWQNPVLPNVGFLFGIWHRLATAMISNKFFVALLCNTFKSFRRQLFLCNSVPSNHTRQFLSLSTVPLDSPSTPCAIVLGENSQYIERQSTGRLPAPFLSPQTLSTGPGGTRGCDWCVHRLQHKHTRQVASTVPNWTV